MAHADINAAKNIRDRASSMVRGDSAKPEPQGSKRPKETSARPRGKRVEPGNLRNQDIKSVMS
jgi:putative transposase